jgi:anti-anti-sigma factor
MLTTGLVGLEQWAQQNARGMGLHMTTAITRRKDATFDCNGAAIRAYSRQLATVVTVRGEIDGVNGDQVSAHVRRFVLGTNPLVLDLSEVTYFSPAGVGMLCMLDDDCRVAGVQWSLVPSPAVVDLLGEHAGDMFPMTGSVHEALRNLADAIGRRRQTVLSLIGKRA